MSDYTTDQVTSKAKRLLLTIKLLREFDQLILEHKSHIQHVVGVRSPVSEVDMEKYIEWHKTTRESILKAIVLSSDAFSQTVNAE